MSKGVGRKISGGGATGKQDRKIAPLSLYLLYSVPCMKVQGGDTAPLPPSVMLSDNKLGDKLHISVIIFLAKLIFVFTVTLIVVL